MNRKQKKHLVSKKSKEEKMPKEEIQCLFVINKM